MLLAAAALVLPHLTGTLPPGCAALPKVGVDYRMNVASASSRPWVNADGWRLERGGSQSFCYDVAGNAAALAAAEAFVYQRSAAIRTDAPGVQAFGQMLAFLRTLEPAPTEVIADVGVVDDGSPETGEVMNLLARHNLLYRVETAPDNRLPVNIRLGSKEFPVSSASNPNEFAQKIRQQITDEKRTLRIYGSDVVLAHLTGDGSRARLHLLNYSDRPVHGLRIRVLGNYTKAKPFICDVPDAQFQDFEAQNGALEFTLPAMFTYAAVDLFSR